MSDSLANKTSTSNLKYEIQDLMYAFIIHGAAQRVKPQ